MMPATMMRATSHAGSAATTCRYTPLRRRPGRLATEEVMGRLAGEPVEGLVLVVPVDEHVHHLLRGTEGAELVVELGAGLPQGRVAPAPDVPEVVALAGPLHHLAGERGHIGPLDDLAIVDPV